MEQTGNPVVAESKQNANSVIMSSRNLKEMIAEETGPATEKIFTREASTLFVYESFLYILQCAYNSAQLGGRSLIYNAVEQVLLDLFRRGVIGKTLDRNISSYFKSSKAV